MSHLFFFLSVYMHACIFTHKELCTAHKASAHARFLARGSDAGQYDAEDMLQWLAMETGDLALIPAYVSPVFSAKLRMALAQLLLRATQSPELLEPSFELEVSTCTITIDTGFRV